MKIILTIFFVISASCNTKSNTNSVDRSPQNKPDTIIKDIPELFRADTMTQHRGFEIEKQLGLNRIDNGFNEYQIRIWIYKSGGLSGKCILFKKDSAGWSSQFFEFVIHLDKNWDQGTVDKKMEARVPKSGWYLFIEKFKATGIDTLHNHLQPVTERHEKYDVNKHSGTVTVEIATKKLYRIYGYPYLYSNKEKFLGWGKLEKTLMLIEKEFDFEY